MDELDERDGILPSGNRTLVARTVELVEEERRVGGELSRKGIGLVRSSWQASLMSQPWIGPERVQQETPPTDTH